MRNQQKWARALLRCGRTNLRLIFTAHHLRPVRTGTVYCTARLRRKGRTMHYSEMEVSDEQGRLVCAMSMSNMVVAAKNQAGNV